MNHFWPIEVIFWPLPRAGEESHKNYSDDSSCPEGYLTRKETVPWVRPLVVGLLQRKT